MSDLFHGRRVDRIISIDGDTVTVNGQKITGVAAEQVRREITGRNSSVLGDTIKPRVSTTSVLQQGTGIVVHIRGSVTIDKGRVTIARHSRQQKLPPAN